MSMDHSANSGSIQSSSGEDDFVSRAAADSFSAIFNISSSAAAAAGSSLPLSSHYQLLDPLSYLDHSSPFPTSAGTSNSWTSILTSPSPAGAAITSSRRFPAADPPSMPVQQTELIAAATGSSAAATTARRSSKKRSRASRRAPTTVMTTNTSNFRAMVQEFTGIPSPPFAAVGGSSAFFPGRSRFDFFSSAASCRSPDPADFPSQYLLRPLAQKAQEFTNANDSISNPSPNTINPTNDMSSFDILGLGNQCKSLSNIQTPILDLHSLIQPSYNPKFALPTMVNAPFNTILGLPAGVMAAESSESNKIYQAHFRSVAGDNDTLQQQDGSNCKLNFSSSGMSEINRPAEKGPETVPAPKGEGMVESWICSSD